MEYKRLDGFPVTFSLANAAELTGVSVIRLRNNIARGILKHVGQIPLAGQERRFAVWGLYEIALIDALQTSGMNLDEAAEVVHAAFGESLGAGYLRYSAEHPETVKPLADMAVKPDQLFDNIEAMPEVWLRGFWTYRDLSNPAIWVFGRLLGRILFGPRMAKGWNDVPAIVAELQKEAVDLTAHTPRVEEEAFSSATLTVLTLFNVTAVLSSIDTAITEFLSRR